MDLDRRYTIRESSHRILNPFTPEKLATLGAALHLPAGARVLDLACGKGELLCTWARDHGVTGVGVDISTAFVAAARGRAAELGVREQVRFEHADAASYTASEPVDVACCIGATWIGGGVPGTLALLGTSLRAGGLVLVGEPFWRQDPPDPAAVAALAPLHASELGWLTLPGLVAHVRGLGWDVVEMVLADEDSWDRYVAAQWRNIRAWLDANPGDELAAEFRDELDAGPLRYVTWQRPHLGWGVLALRRRA
jgi:SAM-dependent methyltransferase